jgi:hypothetical protein
MSALTIIEVKLLSYSADRNPAPRGWRVSHFIAIDDLKQIPQAAAS